MAPLMFAGLVLFMVIGYPAAFSLAAVGLFFGLIGIKLGLIVPDYLGNLTYQLFSVLSNDLLLAIPFFTLMGAILERAGLAEDLLEGFGQLFGGLRGGLSYAVILVGPMLGWMCYWAFVDGRGTRLAAGRTPRVGACTARSRALRCSSRPRK